MNPDSTPEHPAPQQPYSAQQPYPGPQQPYPGQPPYPGPYPAQPQGSTSYGRSLLAALVCLGALVIVLLLILGTPSLRALGQLVGSLVIPLFLSALATWLIFRQKAMAFGILILVSLPSFVLLAVVFGVLRVVGRG